MEGPYRDLGSGFARLTGIEGIRRGPSRINHVEDALLELLRNALDADARNIYVASSLRARRYRTLTVLDDGHGIPEAYKDLIFEPGVTTRYLNPANPISNTPSGATRAAGSGLSLYHTKNAAINAAVLSTGNPASALTSIQATFDTRTLPERASQSDPRTNRSNLPGTLQTFLTENPSPNPPTIYYGSPAAILATIIKNRIIQPSDDNGGNGGDEFSARALMGKGEKLGLNVSLRTVQRVGRGEVKPASPVRERSDKLVGGKKKSIFGPLGSFARLELGQEEKAEIAAILGAAARTRYLEVGELEFESRPGEIVLRSRIYEPEEEYE